jgi:host factor-I protein
MLLVPSPLPVECPMLQEQFLQSLTESRVPVAIYLVNGIRLVGEIGSYDQYGLMLRGSSQQFVFKGAISTIVPSRNPVDSTGPGGATAVSGTERARSATLRPRKPRAP